MVLIIKWLWPLTTESEKVAMCVTGPVALAFSGIGVVIIACRMCATFLLYMCTLVMRGWSLLLAHILGDEYFQ